MGLLFQGAVKPFIRPGIFSPAGDIIVPAGKAAGVYIGYGQIIRLFPGQGAAVGIFENSGAYRAGPALAFPAIEQPEITFTIGQGTELFEKGVELLQEGFLVC